MGGGIGVGPLDSLEQAGIFPGAAGGARAASPAARFEVIMGTQGVEHIGYDHSASFLWKDEMEPQKWVGLVQMIFLIKNGDV